jgi:hypothetical protein
MIFCRVQELRTYIVSLNAAPAAHTTLFLMNTRSLSPGINGL